MQNMERLEDRRLLADVHPVGINFNDEALWDANFATSVAEAKKLGVTAVRLWLSFKTYSERANAWDPVPNWQTEAASRGMDYSNSPGAVMKRAFDLKHAGFSVMVAVVPKEGLVPTSTQQVKDLFTHFKNAKLTPGGSETLADVVDYWEIGNEPDLPSYWADSAIIGIENTTTAKTRGLKSYVDKFLIPAAQALRTGTNAADWEQVVSGGVSWKAEDLNTLLSHLKLRNGLGLIDMAGYHPYGRHDTESSPVITEQIDRVKSAANIAKSFAKPLSGTEWNVRGYSSGWQNNTTRAKWARMMDDVYKTLLVNNFKQLYYFAMLDNYVLRGGNTSARPASVLKHDASDTSLSGKSLSYIESWLKTPAVANEPFYSTFEKWQWGNISGVVVNSGSSASLAGRVVYIDVDNDGALDSNEPRGTTGSDGKYAIKYGTRQVPAGTHEVRVVLPSNFTSTDDDRTLTLGSQANATNVNFTLLHAAPEPATTGSVAGKLWNDTDADNVIDGSESGLSGHTVYLDLDNDSSRDANEPSAVTSGTGAYVINYDTTGTAPGTYALRQIIPGGWETTAVAPMVVVAANRTDTNVNQGSREIPITTGSVAGKLWQDDDADGVIDAGETALAGRTVFIDLDNDASLDAGERSAVTNSSGDFIIHYDTASNITAATHKLQQVIPALWEATTTAAAVTVAGNRTDTGFKLGSRLIPPPTGSIAGVLWQDDDADKSIDATEASLEGRTVWVDVDGDLSRDAEEPSALTDAAGAFTIQYDTTVTPAGTYALRQTLPAGWEQTTLAKAANLRRGGLDAGLQLGSRVIPPITTGSLSGTLWNDADADNIIDSGEAFIAGRAVYVDLDNDNSFDAGEPTANTASNGTYTIAYNVLNVASGDYALRQVLPAGWEQTTPATTVTLAAERSDVNVNLGSRSTTPPVTAITVLEAESASFSGGTVRATNHAGYTGSGFADFAGNGSAATWTITRASAGTVSLDFRYANGSLANRPLQIVVNGAVVGTLNFAKTGAWTTWATNTLNNINLPAGTVTLRAQASTSVGGANVDSLTITESSVVTPPQPTDPKNAVISGYLWNDSDANGIKDTNETFTGARTVFLDTNGNKKLDAGEKSMNSDATGKYTFTGLAAGTYNVARVFPTGYRMSNSATGLLTVTLTASELVTTANIGTTDK